MVFDLTGKVAIVTGGNGGIGLGLAHGLAKAGATIVVAARDAEKSQSAVEKIRLIGVDCTAISTDVTSKESIAAMVSETAERHGRIDILVNNAGVNVRRVAHEVELEEWYKILNTNLTSALLCAQGVYPHMKAVGGGKIINVGSILSFLAGPFTTAYNASKGGLTQLSKALAMSWAPDNIQVNAVLPGYTFTPHLGEMLKSVPGLEESVIKRTPAKRWGTPDDYAGAVVFLASAESDFVTAAEIVVDGGYSVMV
jgi:2-deoxy-D-gluconate 3-dehydrogenase